MKTPVRWLEAEGNAPLGARDLLSAAAPAPAFTDALRYRMAVGVAKTASSKHEVGDDGVLLIPDVRGHGYLHAGHTLIGL